MLPRLYLENTPDYHPHRIQNPNFATSWIPAFPTKVRDRSRERHNGEWNDVTPLVSFPSFLNLCL